jgi:hypothetical protein
VLEHRQKTINRPDDGRLRRGARLLFDRETQLEALIAARMLLRLTPEYQKAARMLCEESLVEQGVQAIEAELDEKGGA